MERHHAAQIFNLLARLWLVLVAAVTARGVIFFVPGTWEAAVEMVFFLGRRSGDCHAVLAVGADGRPAGELDLAIRPDRAVVRLARVADSAVLELLVSVLHLSEEEPVAQGDDQQAIEALVDAATEEGIIEQDEARLIEQVVEFGDKRVRDVMTPRPDVVAIPRVGHARRIAATRGENEIFAPAGLRKVAGRHRGNCVCAGHARSSRPRGRAPHACAN